MKSVWKMENKRIVSSNSISIRKVSFEDPITIEHDLFFVCHLSFQRPISRKENKRMDLVSVARIRS